VIELNILKAKMLIGVGSVHLHQTPFFIYDVFSPYPSPLKEINMYSSNYLIHMVLVWLTDLSNASRHTQISSGFCYIC